MRTSPNFSDVYESAISLVSGSGAANGANGRVDLMSVLPKFKVNSATANGHYNFQTANKGNQEATCISDLYFSKTNVDALHEGIRYRIYTESNGKFVIGRQSDQELMIVMRSIYLQFAKHQPDNVVEQVRDLNQRVLEWTVPEILSNLKQFDVYKRDASTLPIPMAYGEKKTMKGSKQLQMKPFF